MTHRTRRLRCAAALLLGALAAPLLGGVAEALATPESHHPCAATGAAPEAPPAAPAPEAQPPCGAVIQLPCCNEAASLTSAGEDACAAPRAWLSFPAARDLPALAEAVGRRDVVSRSASARAAPPPFLTTTVLRN